MVEYRNKSVIWDSRLPGSGLIFYRVNPSLSGNSSGPPDEVYVFRSGSLNAAFFSAQSGRTTFSDTSEPACVLSDGSPGLKGMVIDQISASGGETMTFRVSFPDVSVPIAKTATQIVVEGFTANWYSSINKDGYLLSVYYKRNGQQTYDSGGFEDRPIGDITSYNVTGLDRSLPTTRWYYCVKAKSGDLLSDASNEIPVTLAPIASAPSATDATGEKRFGFTARWNVAANAVGYLLSVYYKEDGENRYEAGGFQDRLVETGTSSLVTNLDRAVSTQWYYMVKAVSAGGSPTELSNEIAVQLSDQYDPVGCEYAANILSGEGKTVTYFSQSEYVTGHNNYQLAEFAEYYRVQGLSKISAVKMNVFAAKNNSNNSNYAKITVKIWSKTNDGLPGNVLYSKDVALNTIILGENVFNLETPVYVSGDFFVGYQIYYALVNRDVFAVYQTVFGSHPDNTAYIRYGNDWYTTNDLFGDTYYSAALFVFPNICTFLPEPAFVAGETTVEKGNAIQFTNQTVASSETIWLWDFGDGSISREKDPEHIYHSGGVYTVKLTAENNVGLIDLSKTNYVTVTGGTSVASLQNGVEKIYPNPAKNRLTVETEQPAQIQIYSITGALLLQQKINATTVINIDKLRSGVYILKILGADKHLSNYRLIVE
jgi:PKD repeat protein